MCPIENLPLAQIENDYIMKTTEKLINKTIIINNATENYDDNYFETNYSVFFL